MKKNNMPLLAQLLMPVMITFFCGGIIFLCSIKPYERIKTYFNIIFMDNKISDSSDHGMNGLNIKETDINTEHKIGRTHRNTFQYNCYSTNDNKCFT